MGRVKKPKLLLVTWMDATSYFDVPRIGVKKPRHLLTPIESVGWLLAEDKKAIVLSSWCELGGETMLFPRHFLSIPKSQIISRVRLRKGKK